MVETELWIVNFIKINRNVLLFTFYKIDNVRIWKSFLIMFWFSHIFIRIIWDY